jgi:hypothetical protein
LALALIDRPRRTSGEPSLRSENGPASSAHMMLAVSDAKTLGLVILDACRNNVFANIVKSGSD